jgi:HPt (histidine-containing phosphotransfer) domain-containing protein
MLDFKNTNQIENIFKLNNFDSINLEKFNALIMGDIHFGFSLLELFKQQIFNYLNDLNDSFNNHYDNNRFIFQTIHAIKGAALSISADKIVEISKNIERKINDNITLTANDFITLNQEMQKLLEYITALEVIFNHNK